MWPGALSRVFIVNLYNLNCRIITYNTDTSPSLTHRSMRLTKLKTLINILESEARFWSNSLTFRFTCQCSDNILISLNFRENSQTETNIYTWEQTFGHFKARKWARSDPCHIPKSHFAIIDLRSLCNGYFQIQTEKYTVPNISSFNSSF